jgi:chitinase
MVYDVWGPWSSLVGPNAPLNDTCTTHQEGSAVSSVRAWTSAKFPSDKIVLGVPSYGHSYFVKNADAIKNGKLQPYPPFDASKQPAGDSWDAPAGVDQCGNATPAGGVFDFWGLVEGGFLNTQGYANPEPGIYHRFDSCSQTVRR